MPEKNKKVSSVNQVTKISHLNYFMVIISHNYRQRNKKENPKKQTNLLLIEFKIEYYVFSLTMFLLPLDKAFQNILTLFTFRRIYKLCWIQSQIPCYCRDLHCQRNLAIFTRSESKIIFIMSL